MFSQRSAGLLALVLLCLATVSGTAGAAIPASVLPSQDADLVVVMKSQRKLYLYRHGMIIAQYPIALGLNPLGTKRMRGDDKTPIGAYTLDWRNPDSRFHRSLHISYPNANDLAHAASLGVPAGSNVMVHGQPSYDDRPRTGDWTDGCVAVSDHDIDQIWARVPAGTPIHIYP